MTLLPQYRAQLYAAANAAANASLARSTATSILPVVTGARVAGR